MQDNETTAVTDVTTEKPASSAKKTEITESESSAEEVSAKKKEVSEDEVDSPVGNETEISEEEQQEEVETGDVTEEEAAEEVTETTAGTTTAETETSESETLLEAETTIATVEETTSAVTLLEEETAVTTTAETVIVQPQQQEQEFDFSKLEYPLMLLAIVVFCVIVFFYTQSAKKKNHGAKKRDADRVNAKKAAEKEKKDKEKKDKSRKRVVLPKTVRDTLPYKKCLANDIWLINERKYSKAYIVDDINYNLGDEDQQEYMIEMYCNFLNTLDDTVACQISVCNTQIDIKEHEKDIIIKAYSDDGFADSRNEYNDEVLRKNLKKGNNAIQKSIYVTMTIDCPDNETAERRFNSIDLTIKNSFDHIGSTRLRPLTSQERLVRLNDFFLCAEHKIPDFTEEDFKKELEKTYIAPDYFEFKDKYFMFGDWYAKCVFIKEYPNNATDNILNDLMATNLNMICTSNILALDSPKARKLVQRQISAINGDMGQREAKAAKAGYFSQQMPIKIKNQLDSYKELFDMISIEDQKLFMVNTVIMVKAHDFDELNNAMELVNSSLKRNGCAFSEMRWQQEDGMTDCLPVGSQRRFQWTRSLPTESVGIFVPFNVKEVHQKNSIYYGLNKLSNNMIMFNRITSLINPAGFILGCPGSGKSFSAKREMIDAFLRYPEAEIMIIDPEREYPAIVGMFNGQSIKISTSSKNYINPFDFDLKLLEKDDSDDEEYDVIKEKSALITSFIAAMYTDRSLTPQENSFIDRCVRNTYKNSRFLETLDPEDMPILEDLYNTIRDDDDVDPELKRDMLITLEMYVGEGSANYFNHRTNVDIFNRLVSFDIKDLSGVLKTQAMLLVLDNIWNRLSANRDKKIPTWIYCDEIHVLFSNDYCLHFFQGLYKRARKYGGVLTGITQNVSDLLRNEECSTMLSNSEFLLLLKQSPSDSLKLQNALGFTDSELFYVSNVGSGEGLMVLGGKDKIPFYDQFPKETKLYKSMSTNFSETQALKNTG